LPAGGAKSNTARALSDLSQVRLILHRPRSLDNVGAVARVVKNFGLGRLVLVDPLSYSFEKAGKLAVGAEDVVEAMGMEKDLSSALAGCILAVGTTSRRPSRRRLLLPDEAAATLLAAPGPVALVFGDEKRGLSDEDLFSCQIVCRIPAGEAQPSLNLAQAAAVMGYALARSALIEDVEPVESAAGTEPATLGEISELRAMLEELLLTAEFLNPQNPRAILGEMIQPLERGAVTRREVLLWKTAVKKLGRLTGRRSDP
jgi:tRNA/rRNA methyltransferase